MRKLPYNNDIPPAGRRRVVRETGATYHDVAVSDVGTVQGRYAAISRTRVTGSSRVEYQKQPQSLPWASDPVPPEPPLGFSIDEMQPVREEFEVAQSLLREARDGTGMNSPEPPPTSPSGAERSVTGMHLPGALPAPALPSNTDDSEPSS